MTSSIRDRQPKPAPEEGPRHPDYEAISINSLRLDSVFPIKLHTEIDGELIVYRRENMPFTKVQRFAMVQNNIESLYISKKSLNKYWEYLRNSISMLVDTPTIPTPEHIEIFYHTSAVLARQVYEDELTHESIDNMNAIVENNLNFIGEHNSLHQLMPQMEDNPTLWTHSLNVCQYGISLAKELGIDDPQELQEIGLGLMLQDIGMLEVNQELPFRATPLSFEEWNEIKRHPSLGVNRVCQFENFPEIAKQIIFQHHERLDGSGYPQQLYAPEINIHARIAAIVDTFAALTADRPFRPAKTSYEALAIMSNDLGSLYDSKVFKAFVRVLKS